MLSEYTEKKFLLIIVDRLIFIAIYRKEDLWLRCSEKVKLTPSVSSLLSVEGIHRGPISIK